MLPPQTQMVGGLSPPRDARNVDRSMGGGTGTLDELAGSHTRLAIYSTLAICY